MEPMAKRKVIAVNGSPRKKGNTAELLERALDGAAQEGADTKLIHLFDLTFQGCTSCFACKVRGSKYAGGVCSMPDRLKPVLEELLAADAVIIGSPIYLADVTGPVRSLVERLIFPSISYENMGKSLFPGKVDIGFIYTMNNTEDQAAHRHYDWLMDNLDVYLSRLNGSVARLAVYDTLQFGDFSRYAAGGFDEAHKKEVHETQFPKDLHAAFALGRDLALG